MKTVLGTSSYISLQFPMNLKLLHYIKEKKLIFKHYLLYFVLSSYVSVIKLKINDLLDEYYQFRF